MAVDTNLNFDNGQWIMVLGIGLGRSLDIAHWRTLRLLGNRSVIKQTKRPLFKKHRATFAFGNVLCAVIFKKLKIGLIFPIAMGTW